MKEESRRKLFQQIADAAGNNQYTYIAHWVIVNRLKRRNACLKITQIILTAISTVGFLGFITSGIPQLSWLGGFTSALALGLNLYSLNFNLQEDIQSHINAANELWDVRESYKSLITDFDDLSDEIIRSKRDSLTQIVSRINKKYPGTDDKAFAEAQKKISNYLFSDGESAKMLHLSGDNI